MKILIPTRGRATTQTTLKFFPKELQEKTTLVVDYDERHLYDNSPARVWVMPEGLPAGISPKRKYVMENTIDPKIVMLDDDIRFYIRKGYDDWHLRYLEPQEMPQMFGLLEEWLDDYAHCGVSAREGNNRVEKLSVENTRYMRLLAYNLDMLDGVELGRTKIMEDFDVALQLLRQGKPSKVSYYYAQGQRGSNTDGGCSEWRSLETQAEGAERLGSLHPDFVRVVEKKTKTAWGGGIRKDVIISWKKAYGSSQSS